MLQAKVLHSCKHTGRHSLTNSFGNVRGLEHNQRRLGGKNINISGFTFDLFLIKYHKDEEEYIGVDVVCSNYLRTGWSFEAQLEYRMMSLIKGKCFTVLSSYCNEYLQHFTFLQGNGADRLDIIWKDLQGVFIDVG